MPKGELSRRALLKSGGALVVTLAFAPAADVGRAPAYSGQKDVDADAVGGFIAMEASGRVTIYTGKVELGTGVLTAITQIAAEELSVPFGRVTIIQGDTLLTPDQHPTYASLSIQSGGMQIRRAAATAREALLDQAAKKLGVAREQLAVHDGLIAPKSGGPGLTYAQLLAGRKLGLQVDPAAPLKDSRDYKIVGTAVPDSTFRRGFRHIQFRAGFQAARHAAHAHGPPCGSWRNARRLERRRLSQASGVPAYGAQRRSSGGRGHQRMGRHPGSGRNRCDLVRLGRSARGVQLVEYMRDAKIDRNEVLQSVGDTTQGLRVKGRALQATYDFPLTHGSIGPSCAVADFKEGALTVWTPSQATHLLHQQLATMLQMDVERVRCIYIQGAGCYGRNGSDDCSSEAALISKELGQPVRLQWMRADEHGWDPKGPPTLLATAPHSISKTESWPGSLTYFCPNNR